MSSRSSLEWLAVTAAALVGGSLVALPALQPPVGIAALSALLLVALRWNPGVFVGVALLAALNSIPFVDLHRFSLHSEDYVLGLTVVVLGTWLGSSAAGQQAFRSARIPRWLGYWSLAFGALVAANVIRSWVFDDIPAKDAFIFGHDFFAFAVLTPLMALVLAERRSLIGLATLLIMGATLRGIGGIALSSTGSATLGLVHADIAAQQLGLTRLFSPSTDLLEVGIALGLGMAWYFPSRVKRWPLIAAALICLAAILIQLTRARYVGLVVGGGGVMVLWLARTRVHTLRIMTTVIAVALCVIAAAFVLDLRGSSFGGQILDSISQRTTASLQEFGSATSSVGVRRIALDNSTQILGPNWVWGLGFPYPKDHYFVDLTNGTIRDPDLGVMQAVMTIGLLGAVMLFVPFALVLVGLIRHGPEPGSALISALRLGCCLWTGITLAGALTLGTTYSTTGLFLCAAMLAAGLVVLGGIHLQPEEHWR